MRPTKAKAVEIYGLTVVFLLLSACVLFRLDYDQWKKKELSLCQVKLDSTAEALRIMDDLRTSTETSYARHRQDDIRFMTAALGEYITDSGYTGPRLFEDGCVVELRDGEVLWPEGVPLSMEEREQGAQWVGREPAGKDAPFLCSKIGGDHYYVDWNRVDGDEETDAGVSREDFLKMVSESFEGALLLVSTQEDALPILHKSEAYPDAANASALGFTRKAVKQRSAFLVIDGASSMCVYSDLKDGAEALIYVTPLRTLFMRCLPHVVMVELLALIILVTLCHYLLCVFRYIGGHRLTQKQIECYQPKQLRRTVLAAGLTGAVVIFVSTALFQTLDALHEESIIGAKSFNRLFEQLQQTTMDQLSREKKREAEWYVHCGNQMAALIAYDPGAGSRERLKKYCDELDIDYLMLFGSDGRELACSADYAGFTMDSGLGKNSGDFKRLLMGVPSVVHEVSTDSVTGLTRQFIGVRVTASSGSGNRPHGALILAIRPWQFRMTDDEIVERLHRIKSQSILVCYVEPGTGRILYANDATLPGRTVMEYGLPERCMTDGYTDFATLRGVRCYVTTVRRSDVYFIYIIKNSLLFSNTLPATLAATIAYLLVMFVALALCLGKYDESTFRQSVGDLGARAMDEGAPPAEGEETHGLADLMVRRERKRIPKEDRTPEIRVKRAIRFDILLLIFLPALFSLGSTGASIGNGTLLDFLLHGDWNRGFNLFALCSILLMLITEVMLILLSNGLLSLIAGFTGKGGETVCRLLYSLVNYIAVLSMLYFVFDYLGLPISTYIASLSVVSLALSLGAHDMVSDILAGLLIVFEGQFRVGDIVIIDGVQGEVLEIGVRSTRLLNYDNDVHYYTNSTIRKIVNKSKRDSIYKMNLTVVTREPMEQVEAFFRRELPEIGKRLNTIIDGPMLGAITILSSIGNDRNEKFYELRIQTYCKEEDFRDVRAFVNREVHLLCERENIKLWNM